MADDHHWLERRFPTPVEVEDWLLELFPDGMERRDRLTNRNAARTVFVALYTLCVQGWDRWFSPKAVVFMSERQLKRRRSLRGRLEYLARITKPGGSPLGTPWLAMNSREGIRDEAVRALKGVGAILERELPPTSSKGRYALAADFAELFDPAMSDSARRRRWEEWRQRRLSREALARLQLRGGRAQGSVRLPDNTTVRLSPGPSTTIVAALIEQFAPRFLVEPVVLAYSDSSAPASYPAGEAVMRSLGLDYGAGAPLTDVVMADLAEPLRLVFAEAVATEGPVDTGRAEAIRAWIQRAGLDPACAVFVTAYLDRGEAAFRRTVGSVAFPSLVWFASEPERLLVALDGRTIRSIRDLPGY